ncbi:DUF1028 domain-containing protein [Egicoccus halophilus]|uniref:DUF1028 domain-containing protein n=1 Tax=Egicoccus halophilus TaxID=1670830 RepID=UPI00197ACF91|nr:DUF1028 domain-containing protein [Egicoccus halophilus]
MSSTAEVLPVTYSIVARDPRTGQMGVATQTQALAVGASVPWALPGYGVIATQSMGEPMYGELGLDMLRGGLTAPEVLAALRSIDSHPERRQVAMVDAEGGIDVWTGEDCVSSAGHVFGESSVALANMVASPTVWESMIEAYEAAGGPLARRLMKALHAAEDAGGDFRGRRSAAVLVVRAERTGRPWRDQVNNLRVDDHEDPLGELDRLLDQSARYHRVVSAFERALDGEAEQAVVDLDRMREEDPHSEPDLLLWRAIVLALAGREDDARAIFAELAECAPPFVEAARRFGPAGLVPDRHLLERLLPTRT